MDGCIQPFFQHPAAPGKGAAKLAAGLDAAIINPLEQSLMNMLYATELILGRDRYCKKYTTAFRAGKIKLETPA